ncbi:hypothetical protein NOVO_00645 [Rickettsiales bacterium Ac37b]|nr:hypothetical protein NOVO_00645 [Rickettsiales bacterium Ac37b]
MISVSYLLNFSSYSYAKNPVVKLPEWQIYKDSSDYTYSENGYRGLSFVNHKTKEVVIASSGTSTGEHGIIDMVHDIRKDYEILSGRLPTSFYNEELHFARMVIESLKNYQDYKFSFTGHSYGAIVAEVSHFILSKELGIKSQATTFDSPGSAPLIKTIDSTVQFPLKDITIYNGNPNIINTCNKQAGKTFLTIDKEHYIPLPKVLDVYEITSSFIEFLKLTSARHNLQKMIDTVDSKTGKFLFTKEVKKWPILVETIREGLDHAINKLLETKDLSINIKDEFVETVDCFFDKNIKNSKCFGKTFDIAKKGLKILENILDISETNNYIADGVIESISYLGISKTYNDHDEL